VILYRKCELSHRGLLFIEIIKKNDRTKINNYSQLMHCISVYYTKTSSLVMYGDHLTSCRHTNNEPLLGLHTLLAGQYL
jgi:hypothetical protein